MGDIPGTNWMLRLGDNQKEFKERYCPECGKKMAERNKNDYCFACVRKFGTIYK